MFNKKIKKEKINPIVVTELAGSVLFLCLVSQNQENEIFLCKKEKNKFKKIRKINIFSEKNRPENLKGCCNFKIFHSDKAWYLSYFKKDTKFFFKSKKTIIATSIDLSSFKIIDRKEYWEMEFFASVSKSHRNHYLAYFGGKSIKVAASKNFKDWHFSGDLICPRKEEFDYGPLHVVDTLIMKRGILVLYESRINKKKGFNIVIGGALFDLDKPYKLIWRSAEPLLQKNFKKNIFRERYLGCLIKRNYIELYWAKKGGQIFSEKIKLINAGVGSVKSRPVHLKRHHDNPIIRPKTENSWEYDATFNPAAIHLGGKIHLLYRAIGYNGVSVFGYASSRNGINIQERLDSPAFKAMDFSKYSKENQSLLPSKYVSGGSWIGCEDPRMTKIDDRIYMTYTSFDGCNAPGVALTWISVKDFLRKNWTWKRPVLISKPGEIQKNWMLFPEKINNKFAILHSITPEISIEYVDDLEKEGLVINSVKKPGKDEHRWDNIVRGAGAPPIKTEYGWLILYHAMDKKDPNRYKVGAMILDQNDPTKILYRSSCPILEPDAHYENEGAKAGVVYVCGAVIKDNMLYVYYGGADSVVCVATADVKEFLKDITCQTANDFEVKKKIGIAKTNKKINNQLNIKAVNKIQKPAKVLAIKTNKKTKTNPATKKKIAIKIQTKKPRK